MPTSTLQYLDVPEKQYLAPDSVALLNNTALIAEQLGTVDSKLNWIMEALQ